MGQLAEMLIGVFVRTREAATDPNLRRRALHFSYRERKRELRAEGESPRKATNRSTRNWAIMKHQGPLGTGRRES